MEHVNVISFEKVLEEADKLSIDEQETLMEILHRRMIEHKRTILAKEIQKAQREFKHNKCKPATSDEIMKEILS